MGKEKIVKPDAAVVKAMVAQAICIDEKLKKIAGSERRQRQNAQTAAQKLYDARYREALEQMDVEHINRGKQGIRVSLLREAGIKNVLELSKLSYQQLCAIEGIGEQSAGKILDTVKQICQNTKKNLRIRLRIDEPAKEDDELICALYQMVHCGTLRQACSDLYRENHGAVQQEILYAKQVKGGLGWALKSESKKVKIAAAVESLQARMSGGFGDGILLASWEETQTADPQTCWADYQIDASAYHAQLAQLGSHWEKQESVNGGLPAELVAQIEALQPDLRGLKATLRSYQSFGTKYIIHQKKTLLGDEMGLGKTMQAIASMVALAAEGKSHFMVVCPAAVLVNWCREIKKFSDLDVTKVHGSDEEALLYWRQNGGVAVTTYESISRFTLPERFKISMVIADEAHYAKNPEAQRTKALVQMLQRAEHVLFMSGTPLENKVEEMCFLVSCLQPQLAEELKRVSTLSTAEQFRQQLAPVYLRRTREDVLQELPELTEKEQWCVLGEAEQKVYKEAVMSENFMAIRQVSWQVDDLAQSSKACRLLELCEQAKEQKRKVIVFSFFRSTLQKVTQLLADRCLEPITGDISPQKRQQIVDGFAKAPDGAVLASQVQAGGTGLNIQSASVIIFCEPQIKPSIEAQAISRAYRMGQVRDVLVYRLLADDTVDEKIMELLKTKQQRFDRFAEESVVGEESLKPDETAWIGSLVEEEKKRLQDT